MSNVPEDPNGEDEQAHGRARGLSASSPGGLNSVKETNDDVDRVDARNAAARLAQSSF